MLNSLKCLTAMALTIVLFAGGASAHEGHEHGGDKGQHLMGTVESVSNKKLVVMAADGKSVSVHIDANTRYENGDAPGKVSDLKAGVKVVVQGEPMKDGTLHATKVRYGKPGKSH